MKAITLILAFVSSMAFAREDSIQWARHIAGKAVSVKNYCPSEKRGCRPTQKEIAFEFVLGGCVDQILPVAMEYDDVSNTVYISAVNLHLERSNHIKCIKAKTSTASVVVPLSAELIDVHYLGTDRWEQVKMQ